MYTRLFERPYITDSMNEKGGNGDNSSKELNLEMKSMSMSSDESFK